MYVESEAEDKNTEPEDWNYAEDLNILCSILDHSPGAPPVSLNYSSKV